MKNYEKLNYVTYKLILNLKYKYLMCILIDLKFANNYYHLNIL